MRSHVFEALMAFGVVSIGDAFMMGSGSPFALKAAATTQAARNTREHTHHVAAMSTRRDFVENAGIAVAGVLGSSLLLPAASNAETPKTMSDREVFTTKGGVKFIVLKEGSGPVARDGDYLIVEFTGFLPDGQVFDASNAPGRKPIAFKLGARQVIQGWEEVLRLMNAGAEVQMVVPPAMAFGDKGICIESGDCLVKPGQEAMAPEAVEYFADKKDTVP